ncbi:MAG: type II and III secretion system protein [Gracilimonas sp.]|uniref:type II secretion system protein GspD n=2 Tax=Gracilimonas sp. TaxID=1974203 RepID=UPI001B158A93|nr:type II and III secretion system protein [Gracilimonas sp.]MBO6586356.1 type II and III secretion system protein [Gracilimonas sp.]MBO6615013.1 type II and III secretion system protein [Gracilimonas sp.]
MKPMKATFYTKGFLSLVLFGLVSLLQPQLVHAQVVDPLKEYTNPEEIVAFDKSTTYNEAIEIINTFAQEFENRFIVDNSAYSGTIGVTLPAMHWKDALQYIMRFNNLELEEYEDFYEINVPAPPTTGTTTQASGGGSNASQGQPPTATTRTQEVRINATFFEGNKRALQEIGIDWSTLTSDVPANLGDFVGADGNQGIPSTDFNDQFVSVNSYNAASVSQNAFNALVNLGEVGPGISVQALFSAFEADNLGKVLATPSIKVVDGEEGNIQVGQDFSIKQRDIAGNVTDNFISTGTILTVTPEIISQGDTSFIYLSLEVERSTVLPDVVSTIVNKQEATTSAILLNGEATYVAGLYRTEESSVRRGVPILKDLPGWFFGLRYLFGYNSKDYSENELIIIVQAELIKPVSERISDRKLTKREVLNNTRDGMRTDLDRVFTTETFDMPVEEEIAEAQQEEQPAMDDSTLAETDKDNTQPDTMTVEEQPVDAEEEDALTDEQQELAKDLSMPVDKPELMVVVPKAFNLDEYLEYQQNEQQVETMQEETSNLKYFVIGGSFLVPGNAQNFKSTLEQEGYNTQILFNPETRFNYVAYEGFADFNTAVERTLEIRDSFNSEAWLFTLRNGNNPNAERVNGSSE